MKKALRAVGDRLQFGTLHPWHVGLLLGLKNLLICVGAGVLIAVSWQVTPSWFYLYAVLPILLLVFWLWYTHHLLRLYPHIQFHDSMLIALGGSLPFMLIFCFSTIMVYWLSFGGDVTLTLGGFYANTLGVSLGAVFVEFTVIAFGLHHPFKRKFPSSYV